MSKRIASAVLAAVLIAVLPLYLEGFWLQTGLFAMASAIGAIGLTLLVGVTGQLSLGHAFFLAVGAYGYCYLAGGDAVPGLQSAAGSGCRRWRRWPARSRSRASPGCCSARSPGACAASTSAWRRSAWSSSASTSCSTRPTITGGFNGRDATPFAVRRLHASTTRTRC